MRMNFKQCLTIFKRYEVEIKWANKYVDKNILSNHIKTKYGYVTALSVGDLVVGIYKECCRVP
jgi:hypothetical protein